MERNHNKRTDKERKGGFFGFSFKRLGLEISHRAGEIADALKSFFYKLGKEQDELIPGAPQLSSEVSESFLVRRRMVVSLAFAALGFLFAGARGFLGSYPFALALLCASGYAGSVFVYIGALVGALVLGQGALGAAVTYTLTFGARLALSAGADISVAQRSFEENMTLRCLIACVSGFLLGLGRVISETFSVTSVLAMLFMTVAVPIFTFALRGALGRGFTSLMHDSSVCVLLFLLIYSLGGYGAFGFSLAAMLSCFIIFYVSSVNGFLRGSLIGIICGLAFDARLAPAFAILGMASGALRIVGLGASIVLSSLLSLVVIAYSGGGSLLLANVGSILFAAVIFWPLSKNGMLPGIRIFSGIHERTQDKYAQEKRRACEKERFAAMSESFDEIASSFLKLSDRHKYPGTYELREMCSAAVTKNCRSCPLNALCWQKDHSENSELLDILSEKLRTGGTLTREDLPERFKKRCRSVDRLIADLNSGAAELIENAIKRDKTELFALDYEAMSELLRSAVSENDAEFESDPVLAKKVSDLLGRLGVRSAAWGAWGKRKKTVVASGIDIGTLTLTSQEIKRLLCEETGLSLCDPKFKFDGDYVTMTLESRENFELEAYTLGAKKTSESESGDVIRVFSSSNDMSYAMICDGMGSGQRAAECAGISALFIEKMLSAGNFKSVTMKMLSNFIRSRGEECHCTVDLFEFDRLSGEGSFVKCGAAASYVLRSGNLFKIDASTMPLGITREINAENIKMTLCPGDVIVMMSDGVAHCLEDALWVPELIIAGAGSCESTARAIYERALGENGGRDDISVAVMKVSSL